MNRLAVILLGVLSSASATAETVQDLRYGVTLYYFYQQDYFNALTELTAAAATQSLPHHADQASLLKGGMSLSYGLDRDAEASFTHWLTTPPAVPLTAEDGSALDDEVVEAAEQALARWQRQHKRAWFYLGRLNYQRGDDARALTALQQLDNAFAGDGSTASKKETEKNQSIQQESHYLQAKLLLQQGAMDAAASMAAKLPANSVYLPYYWYNRGGQLALKGDWLAAAEAYKQLDQLVLETDVEKTLRDRALTAAGFAQLHEQNMELAIADFSQVRLDSPMADRALLGLGWAQLQAGKPENALAPWQQLRSESLLQSGVQEVYLALPYAYEQLDADAAALNEYEFARDAFSQELVKVTAAIDDYKNQPLADLFGFDISADSDWLLPEEIHPVTDNAPYLSHLFARHSFQSAVKDYRDLISLRHYLARAQERLQVLRIVDSEQQALWQRLIDGGELDQYRQRFQELTVAHEILEQRIAAASADNSGRLLADEQRMDLWRRLERSEDTFIAIHKTGEVSSKEREQLIRYRGLLLWDDSENYPMALWELKKMRVQLSQTLEQAKQQLASVEQTVAQRSQSLFLARIDQLAASTDQQQLSVAEKLAEQEQTIRQLAVTELEQQHQQLRFYLGKAKLSIARLYDENSQETAR